MLSFNLNSVDLAVHRWSKLLSMLESLSVHSFSLSVADAQILGVLKDEHNNSIVYLKSYVAIDALKYMSWSPCKPSVFTQIIMHIHKLFGQMYKVFQTLIKM